MRDTCEPWDGFHTSSRFIEELQRNLNGSVLAIELDIACDPNANLHDHTLFPNQGGRANWLKRQNKLMKSNSKDI